MCIANSRSTKKVLNKQIKIGNSVCNFILLPDSGFSGHHH